jgi:Macrocin-O-methyltransferase (TylF).
MISKILNKVFVPLGYNLSKIEEEKIYVEMNDIYSLCSAFTMTSKARMFALYKSIEYIIKNNIPGDFVECGVWRGGSSMLIAYTLQKFGVTDRNIWLYDTFEGMSAPTENDADIAGNRAEDLLMKASKENQNSVWCFSSLDEVKQNLKSTNYPENLIHFIQGKVEDTIPLHTPSSISLLRLDTDWYESTKHEMKYLFPLLMQKGVIIIDDYGHWVGAKKAIDEYLEEKNIALLLNVIDYTGRIAVKC